MNIGKNIGDLILQGKYAEAKDLLVSGNIKDLVFNTAVYLAEHTRIDTETCIEITQKVLNDSENIVAINWLNGFVFVQDKEYLPKNVAYKQFEWTNELPEPYYMGLPPTPKILLGKKSVDVSKKKPKRNALCACGEKVKKCQCKN